MRFFDEETGGKPITETLVLLNIADADLIITAMKEYTERNPRKKKVKTLYDEMYRKWGIM